MFMWKSYKDSVVQGNRKFAIDLFQKLATKERNLCFSPHSLSVLFAMLYAGARGNTASQIAQTLHFHADQKALHSQIADIHQQLIAGSKQGFYELRIGNRIWSQVGYPLQRAFLETVATHYQSGVEQTDFSQSQETCEVMNRWIEKQTGGLIKNLVNQGMFSATSRAIPTSAIYFKGMWVDPFWKKATRDEDFWVSPQRMVRTPMMQRQLDVPYAEHSDVQMLELPYRHLEDRAQPAMSMFVLLPRTRGELENISNRLHPRQLERWLHGLKSQTVKIFLPKFRIESLCAPRNALEALGMVNAFDPLTADFSGMAQTEEPYWIEKLLQKAYINVDEEGTEAAAVSMSTFFTCMTRGKRPPIPVFRADHPFLFLIRHNPSGCIVFIGKVNDPQEQSAQRE